MPSQQQVEYYRKKYQQFTPFKLKISIFISLLSNVSLAPFELLKVRAQLLQEGRKLHGFGTERGVPMVRTFESIIESGSGIRGLYTGFDSLFIRSLWYGGFRCYLWCSLYNYVNKDPRRTPHWAVESLTSFAAGFLAGVITNPIDIVYNRQAADSLYPEHLKRNYSSFFDGLFKVNAERALLRGSIASGFSYGALLASMSGTYDFLKEYWYWFFGAAEWLRPVVLIPTTLLGILVYLPFDNMKVRYHTMTALPNGEMPYKGFIDSFTKVLQYEANVFRHSSYLALASGAAPAYIRLYLTLFAGIKVTDYTFHHNYEEGEFWEPANVYSAPTLGLISHDPYHHVDLNEALLNENNPYTYKVELGPGSKSYLKY